MAIRSGGSDSARPSGLSDSAGASARDGPAPHAGMDTAHATVGDLVGFIVQFAANLNVDNARSIAATIDARGSRPRVVATARGGVTVYRVVLGPYATRAQADSVGQVAHRMYWVYEGTP
jgi:cell division septation protein DedD